MNAFAEAAGSVVDFLGPDRVRTLADGIEHGASDAGLADAHPIPGAADAIAVMVSAMKIGGIATPESVAYLRGLADGHARRSASQSVESVWTGPSTHEVPVRSTAQVLTTLIGEARRDMLLMTYSAARHPPVIEALCAARQRGVTVTIVVETLQGAGGAISGAEPATAFVEIPGAQLLQWAPGCRPGASSKMHAKVAIADRQAMLVSSANLTQSGISTNLEAGVLVRGGAAPRRAAEHITQLVAAEVIVPLNAGT